MFKTRTNIPEQPKVPPMPSMAAEVDRLYLEKCQEVNDLEQKVEKYKSMAEIAVKQKAELREQLEQIKQEALVADLISREEALKAVNTANSTVIGLPDMRADYLNDIVRQFDKRYSRALELIEAIPAVPSASTIRELAAEPLRGFTPDVEPPEELPELLWDSQAVTTQDILCLSSALKNLYEIHKTDGWLLYTKLCKVLEKKIEEYCSEEG